MSRVSRGGDQKRFARLASRMLADRKREQAFRLPRRHLGMVTDQREIEHPPPLLARNEGARVIGSNSRWRHTVRRELNGLGGLKKSTLTRNQRATFGPNLAGRHGFTGDQSMPIKGVNALYYRIILLLFIEHTPSMRIRRVNEKNSGQHVRARFQRTGQRPEINSDTASPLSRFTVITRPLSGSLARTRAMIELSSLKSTRRLP